jgi:hypothetical protein
MHQVKIIGATQADIHHFKNVKWKVLKCNANLFFNQAKIKNFR